MRNEQTLLLDCFLSGVHYAGNVLIKMNGQVPSSALLHGIYGECVVCAGGGMLKAVKELVSKISGW